MQYKNTEKKCGCNFSSSRISELVANGISQHNLWVQIGQDIDGTTANDRSDKSVAISNNGKIMAFGENSHDVSKGTVRVYEFDGSLWVQLGGDIDGEFILDQSGGSISLSGIGDIVAIGAIGNDDNGSDSGNVRIFKYDGSNWNQLGNDIDGESPMDNSGISVSLSDDGNIVAIGANLNDGVPGPDSGHVRVYKFDGTNWNQLGQDIDGENAGDRSGESVALSNNGQIVAIGATLNGDGGVFAGQVRVYEFNGIAWVQRGQDIDGDPVDRFGQSVSLSGDGNIVAIGAPFKNAATNGYVSVYEFNGVNWVKLGDDIDGENVGDESYIVSLSNDGKKVAIGAPGNNASTGYVRVFAFNGSNWIKIGQNIIGESAGDQSGAGVALSDDGKIVAISSTGNNGTINPVQIRVYKFIGDLLQTSYSLIQLSLLLSC